jgi:hypothetical protein
MTSTQVTQCHLTVTSQTYITVPHLLEWARGRSIVMLCVKEPRDIARAITTIIENNATDRTFLELRLVTRSPSCPLFASHKASNALIRHNTPQPALVLSPS